jgi:hypothetical protein
MKRSPPDAGSEEAESRTEQHLRELHNASSVVAPTNDITPSEADLLGLTARGSSQSVNRNM